jgi:thioredoxin-like negative regulator of GroEL
MYNTKDQSMAALALFDTERASLNAMLVEADFDQLDTEVMDVLVQATTSKDSEDLLSARFALVERQKLFQDLHHHASGCFGDEDPRTAASLHSLASVYNAQGRHEEALEHDGCALAVQQTALGEEHPSVGRTLNKMAGVYDGQGHYERRRCIPTGARSR